MSITINENIYFLFGLKFSFFICKKLSLPILLDITFSRFKQNNEQSKKREPYRENLGNYERRRRIFYNYLCFFFIRNVMRTMTLPIAYSLIINI